MEGKDVGGSYQKRKNLTEIIKFLLTKEARYRDDDNLLINRIQKDELFRLGYDVKKLTTYDFFVLRLQKQISSEETIISIRKEVNEYYPETISEKKTEPPPIEQDCFLCQGSGTYESHTCNVCNGTGVEIIKK